MPVSASASTVNQQPARAPAGPAVEEDDDDGEPPINVRNHTNSNAPFRPAGAVVNNRLPIRNGPLPVGANNNAVARARLNATLRVFPPPDEEAIRASRALRALRVRVQYRLDHYDPNKWDNGMRNALAACRIYNGNTVMLLPPSANEVWNHLLGGQHPRVYSFGIPGHADTIERFAERDKGVLVSLHEKGVELARRLPAICVVAWLDYPFDQGTDFFVQASQMAATGHRNNSVAVFVDPSVFPEVQSVMEDVIAGV